MQHYALPCIVVPLPYRALPYPALPCLFLIELRPALALPCYAAALTCLTLLCLIFAVIKRQAFTNMSILAFAFKCFVELRPALALPCYAAALTCLTLLCLIFAVIKRQAFTNMSILAFAFKCFAAFFATSDRHYLRSIQLFCHP